MRYRILLSLLACGQVACLGSSGSDGTSSYTDKMEAEEPEASANAAQAPSVTRSAGKMAKLDMARARGGTGVERTISGEDMPAELAPEAPPKKKRMVHYSGYLRLKVTNPTQALQQASEMVDAIGGYVETLTATSVALRVPVAHFRTVFSDLTTIGDVLSRSMSATDVTDAFIATELRAKILRASRDRLIALLGKAQRPREKLRLLREVRRLTEQIDQLEMQLTALASLADFSRLTLEVEPHQVQVRSAAQEPIAAFRWIHRLTPFAEHVALEGDELELAVPPGLVALADRDSFIAESADGAKLWTSVRENYPRGSTTFWIEAVRTRLGPEYGAAEVSTVGEFEVLRLVDQSEKAYRYLVGVRAKGDDLAVVEVYYPGEDQERRYGPAIEAAIKHGGAV